MVTSGSDDYRDGGLVFPPGFIVGSATASYQIEGAVSEDGRGPSIWDTFSHTPGKTFNGDTGDVADDHYHRWESDLDLMKQLGLHSYRFSIAWPRIQADGTGKPNLVGIAFYYRLVDGLLARGIRPVATLYHWDLPQALEDAGGWTNRDTSLRFAEYSALVAEALGDRIETWTTLNEPWCSAYLGYAGGVHAPGRQSGAAALSAVHHLNLAHGLAAQEVRRAATNDPDLSVTLNLHLLRGDDESSPEAIRRIDLLGNRAFLDPMLNGVYPQELFDDTAQITDWAFVRPGDLEGIHQPLDVLGINYYMTSTLRMRQPGQAPRQELHNGTASPWPGAADVDFLEQPGPYTAMGWNIAPDGLEELLVNTHEEWPELPLMVTENGATYDDTVVDGAVHDTERIDYLNRHFTAAHRAIQRGVELRGYFVWSLMDNFEWSYGYAKRFGIVRNDYVTQERLIKDSGHWTAEVAATLTTPEVDS